MSKILVVEDEPAVREVVEHTLCKEGLQTVGVQSGEEALRCLLRESEPFDLVILEVRPAPVQTTQNHRAACLLYGGRIGLLCTRSHVASLSCT
ncbi:MAG: hypothetical protein M3M97_07010 [Actinomycetota bacterium]|nr:hypothetical protein [Actinomycetota bacterium]